MDDAALRAALETEPRITYALIFGSVARGSAHAGSDLDVAIGLRPGPPLAPLEIGAIVSALESATRRDVDLVLLDEAPPGLAYRIFRDGRVVYERDRAAFVERKARAIFEYLDYRPFEEIFTRGAIAAAARGR